MRTILPSPLLRGALILDAAVSAGAGLLQWAGGARAAEALSLPTPLLVETGVFLLLYAAVLVAMARSRALPAWWVMTVAGGNVGWALGCVAAPLAGWVTPTGLGQAWLAVHVVAVLVFATAQTLGLARSTPAAGSLSLAGS